MHAQARPLAMIVTGPIAGHLSAKWEARKMSPVRAPLQLRWSGAHFLERVLMQSAGAVVACRHSNTECKRQT